MADDYFQQVKLFLVPRLFRMTELLVRLVDKRIIYYNCYSHYRHNLSSSSYNHNSVE